jgi:hypothetical protein
MASMTRGRFIKKIEVLKQVFLVFWNTNAVGILTVGTNHDEIAFGKADDDAGMIELLAVLP